jgi:hypothetical protein
MTCVLCLMVIVPFAPYIAPPERLRDRLVAWLSTRSLDTALASGTPAEADAALALRARRLTTLPRRRKVALAIRHLIREAEGAVAPARLRVSPVPDRVSAASRELRLLAKKLAEPTPVSARGVAETLLLLTDGTGPLYNPRNEGSVRDSAANAAAHLSPAR